VLQAAEPEAAGAVAQVAEGVAARQLALALPGATAQGRDQVLFVVAPQPDGPALFHQAPDALHRGADRRAAVDHIAAKDQPVAAGKALQQLLEGVSATMDVADHPVVEPAADGRHRDVALPAV
jgi:hypothetical protein